jgi:hypothetical protein
MRNAYKMLVRKSEEKRPLRRIILKYILKKQSLKMWAGFIWLRKGPSSGLL